MDCLEQTLITSPWSASCRWPHFADNFVECYKEYDCYTNHFTELSTTHSNIIYEENKKEKPNK